MAKRIAWIVLVGIGSFLGGLAHLQWVSRAASEAQAQAPAREPAAATVTDLVALGDRFELVAKRVAPAVVYVEARKPSEKPAANGGARIVEESGSGVIVRLDGRTDYLVLTNSHVVAGAAPERVIVHLSDGRVLRPSRIWNDPESDVGLLSIEGITHLPTARLGDSDKMQVGHWVLAIGSPFGLNQTVTHGIISAKDRGQISLGNTIRIKDFLQTDAAINPGSSGGPLVNLNGEVIGINTAIASPNGSNSGIAFSIPINLFKRLMLQLLDRGIVSRGYLGVQLSESFEPHDALKLGLDRAQGALVEAVYPGTPAALAGIRPGDVILEVDQLVVRNENHLINYISGLSDGKSVAIVLWRDRKKLTLTATVADWTAGQGPARR